MHKVAIAVITLLILILSASSADADRLFVINGLAETLSEVDLDDGTVTNDIATLGLYPNDIIIVRDSAYIINSGSDNVFVYDLVVEQIVDTYDVGAGRNPYRIVEVAPDTLLITNWLANSLTRITTAGQIVGEYPIDGTNPQGMLVSGDTTFLTTVSFVWQDTSYDAGVVIAWDNHGDSAVAACPVGNNPNDLTMGPDGNLWICCTGQYDGTGSVYVIDPVSVAVIDSILTGGDPTDIAIVPNGIAFLAAGNGWWPPGSEGDLITIDVSSHTILHGSGDPLKTDGGPMSVIIASDSTVFSFNFAANTVTEVDASGNDLRRFNVGDGAQIGAIRFDCQIARGDVNGTGAIDIDDIVYLIAYVFQGGDAPVECSGKSLGNVNCSLGIDIDDIVYLIAYVFQGGPEPCD